jgi:hypothetical protein
VAQHSKHTKGRAPDGVRPSPWLWLQPIVVSLVIALAFVGLYLGFARDPVPHGVPVAVVGRGLTAQASSALGSAVQVREVADQAGGDRLLRNADVLGVLIPEGRTLHLDVAGASGQTTVNALEHAVSAFAVGAKAPLTVSDLVPLSRFDSRGMAGFYVSFGVTVASLALAQNLLAASASLKPRRRFLPALGFNVVVGTAAGAIAGPVYGAIPAPLLPTAAILTLLSTAAVFTALALRKWLGPIGIPLGTLIFVTLGNSTSGGTIGEDLLPAPARAVSPLLPPGAAVRALRYTSYFHGAHLLGPLLALSCWAVLAGALAVAPRRSRRSPRGAVAGQVSLWGASGRAIGATAVITNSDGQVMGHTAVDAHGTFRVDHLPAGDATVTVVSTGYAPRVVSIHVDPERTTTAEFAVYPENSTSRQQGWPDPGSAGRRP